MENSPETPSPVRQMAANFWELSPSRTTPQEVEEALNQAADAGRTTPEEKLLWIASSHHPLFVLTLTKELLARNLITEQIAYEAMEQCCRTHSQYLKENPQKDGSTEFPGKQYELLAEGFQLLAQDCP